MDPTGTAALNAGLQAFSSGYVQFQTETRENFDKLWVWAEGLSLAVTDVQESMAAVKAELNLLETKVDTFRDEVNQKFAVLFKHLGIQ